MSESYVAVTVSADDVKDLLDHGQYEKLMENDLMPEVLKTARDVLSTNVHDSGIFEESVCDAISSVLQENGL